MDGLSLTLTVVSLVLAVAAIVLSVLFYRWADAEAKRAADVYASINSATSRLEATTTMLQRESFGLVRDSLAGVLALASNGVVRTHAESAPRETQMPVAGVPGRSQDRGAARQPTDRELLSAMAALGAHMRKKRGTGFAGAMKDLQKRILAELDKEPPGTVVSNGELARRLGDQYDIGEVVYGAHLLAESGRLANVDAD